MGKTGTTSFFCSSLRWLLILLIFPVLFVVTAPATAMATPPLQIDCSNGDWLSFRDWIERSYSVQCSIVNPGSSAVNLTVTGAHANKGVTTVDSVPMDLGGIDPTEDPLQPTVIWWRFHVPRFVTSFTATLTFNAGGTTMVRTADATLPPLVEHGIPTPPPPVISEQSGGDCESQLGGTWDQGTKTCTLTSDIDISLEPGNGIIVDGTGIPTDDHIGITLDGGPSRHKIIGAGSGNGVTVMGKNMKVQNVDVQNFQNGIKVNNSDHVLITRVNVSGNVVGIYTDPSTDVSVTYSNIFNNSSYGILSEDSSGGSYTDNNLDGNGAQVSISGGTGNTVQGNYYSDNPGGGAYTFNGGQDSQPSAAPVVICGIMPSLSLGGAHAFWADYDAYVAHLLSVEYTVNNSGADPAYNVRIVGATASNGVTCNAQLPLLAGNIASSGNVVLTYSVPPGVAAFKASIYATAEDGCGNVYEYPGPYSG